VLVHHNAEVEVFYITNVYSTTKPALSRLVASNCRPDPPDNTVTARKQKRSDGSNCGRERAYWYIPDHAGSHRRLKPSANVSKGLPAAARSKTQTCFLASIGYAGVRVFEANRSECAQQRAGRVKTRGCSITSALHMPHSHTSRNHSPQPQQQPFRIAG
jgi:hypothetical protein